jgi:uncharacterized protein (DUF305 family)
MDLIKHPRALLVSAMLALGVLLAGVALTACGSDNNNDSAAASAAGNGTDRAFVADMIPHHKSAVEMASIAKTRGQSTFVKNLASDIIRTQNAEITTMRREDAALAKAGVKTGSLGIDNHMMGMDMDPSKLTGADPFDKTFLNMMIPHHQGAITMAKVELANGSDPQLKQLAQNIITAQQREIREMRAEGSMGSGAMPKHSSR